MIDPKKLMAFIAKENNKNPLKHPDDEDNNPDDMDLEDEDMDMDMEAEGGGDEGEDLDEEVEAEITEEDIAEIVEMIEAGEGDPQLMELAEELLLDMEELGEEANPPAWAANPAIWAEAEKAVDPEGKGSKYTEPYSVVAHVYKKMGGTVK